MMMEETDPAPGSGRHDYEDVNKTGRVERVEGDEQQAGEHAGSLRRQPSIITTSSAPAGQSHAQTDRATAAQSPTHEVADRIDGKAPSRPHTPGLIPATPLSPSLRTTSDDLAASSSSQQESSANLDPARQYGMNASRRREAIQDPSQDDQLLAAPTIDPKRPTTPKQGQAQFRSPASSSAAVIPTTPLPPSPSPSSHPSQVQQSSISLPSMAPYPPQPPNFQPFFTLIADLDEEQADAALQGHDVSSDAQIHHPVNVHYIFADDEDWADRVGAACMQAAGKMQDGKEHRNGDLDSDQVKGVNRRDDGGPTSPVARHAVSKDHRVVIIDMNSTGDAVTKATSLSPDWQVISADVQNAPTWDRKENSVGGQATQTMASDSHGNPAGPASMLGTVAAGLPVPDSIEDRTLMLHIQGVGITPCSVGRPGGSTAAAAAAPGGAGAISGSSRPTSRKGDVSSESISRPASAHSPRLGVADTAKSRRQPGSVAGDDSTIDATEQMHALMATFDRKMRLLRKIVGDDGRSVEDVLDTGDDEHEETRLAGEGQGDHGGVSAGRS